MNPCRYTVQMHNMWVLQSSNQCIIPNLSPQNWQLHRSAHFLIEHTNAGCSLFYCFFILRKAVCWLFVALPWSHFSVVLTHCTAYVAEWEAAHPDANITHVNPPEILMHCALIMQLTPTQQASPSGSFMSLEMCLWRPDRLFVALSLYCLCLSILEVPWVRPRWRPMCYYWPMIKWLPRPSWIMHSKREATPPSVM